MSYEDYKMRYRIATIYILNDALERELTAFKPIKTLNNNRASVEFESSKIKATNLRRYMDKYLGDHAEGWGDCADDIIELIEKHIKEVETKELAKQNKLN